MSLDNKVVWITGASSGIGRALAQELSKNKVKLILSGRNQEQLALTAKFCEDVPMALLPFDLLDLEHMPQIVQSALQFFGEIDILINNGGISQRSLAMETDVAVDKKIMEVDYFGTVALTKALLPHFVHQKRGHIVTITSIMGKFSSPYRSGYCAAKHALHGFFDALRLEHHHHNLRVTLICPGFVNTNVSQNALNSKGVAQDIHDPATLNGMEPLVFARAALKAIKKEKMEVYIGGKEINGVYLKRFFPKVLHKYLLKKKVK